MQFTKHELTLIREALIMKYKQQTELLNRKRNRDWETDPVCIKWHELRELINKINKIENTMKLNGNPIIK